MNRWLRVLLLLGFGAALAFAWGAGATTLTRGPFLQALTPTEISVVFKTDASVTPVLGYGTVPGAPQFVVTGTSGTTHVFRLTDLRPDTRYYYRISDGSTVIAGGKQLVFRTAPPERSRAPFRFLAFGDSGTGNTAQYDVAEQMEKVVPAPDFALGLGDLVYESGAAADFDPKLFRPYENLLPHMVFWPTIGNHEARTQNGAPFYEAFYLPTATGAPGHPSNSERYYSFDYGMAHFVCLDSETSSSAPGSVMYEWASDDLDDARARDKRWIIAFMHHPPYSKGSHDSDDEGELITLRENLVPLLESKGVDMVLVGHSHSYERSFLAQGDAVLQNDPDTYTKIGTPNGTLYIVSGCGGKSEGGSLDHPLMSVSYGNVNGFNAIDVTHEELRGYFIEKDGTTTDVFAVHKAADVKAPRLASLEAVSATELIATFDEPLEAGSATAGAENIANYLMSGGESVLGAALDSDLHTVKLTTSPLTSNTSYELTVLRVEDVTGNAIDQTARFVLAGAASGPGIPEGAPWRYFKGSSAPPATWNTRSFVDSSWAEGPAGFGYEDADDATELTDMKDAYLSVFARATFTLDAPERITGIDLRVSFDDGFVAYLNGTEVARVNVPAGQTNTTAASASHEADAFESFDLDAFLGSLSAGTNVLAVQGHNSSASNSDFSLHPALDLIESSGGSGPPLARIDCDVSAANVGARIDFSSEGSRDGDGTLTRRSWHFGDGTATVEAETVQRLFDREGTFEVSLVVEDDDGLESIDKKTIRIHSLGTGPSAAVTADDTQIDAGGSVQFSSAGSQDPDGGSVYLHWDFDDPASGAVNHATGAAPSHRFDTDGNYSVTLTVTDDEGSGETHASLITVGARTVPAPTAGFVSDVVAGRPPLQVTFTDQTTGDVTSWAWDFGDGGSSTERNPVHVYTTEGDFTVTLLASGPGGIDTEVKVGHVQVDAGGPIGGGSSGGGCSGAIDPGARSTGDSSFAFVLASVILALALQRRAARRRSTTEVTRLA